MTNYIELGNIKINLPKVIEPPVFGINRTTNNCPQQLDFFYIILSFRNDRNLGWIVFSYVYLDYWQVICSVIQFVSSIPRLDVFTQTAWRCGLLRFILGYYNCLCQAPLSSYEILLLCFFHALKCLSRYVNAYFVHFIANIVNSRMYVVEYIKYTL